MTTRILCSLALAAALIAGCKEEPAPAPKVDNTPKVPSVDDVKKAADNAAKNATDATKNATATATDAAKTAADEAKKNASGWMTKLEAAIKDNKLDDAKTYLDKLNAIKAQLPADLQSKLDAATKAFDAAKAKAAVPGLPK